MRIAFATRDGERLEDELRLAPRLDVYLVTADGVRLERTCALDEEARGASARIRALAGVELVYVAAIGPSTAARLARSGIRAATARAGTQIARLVERWHEALASEARAAAAAGPGEREPR